MTKTEKSIGILRRVDAFLTGSSELVINFWEEGLPYDKVWNAHCLTLGQKYKNKDFGLT